MDWIKELKPQEMILLVGGLLLLVLIIIILIKVIRIAREIASRSLKMTEEILNTDDSIVTNLKVVNRSYIDNEITEIGMIYQKKKVIILEEDLRVNARNRLEHIVTHDEVRDLLGIKEFKIKRVKFYYENSVGDITKTSARLTRKEIKKALKQEKKDYIQALKEKRYEEGNYTTGDRISIFFGNIFGPIKRARRNSIIKKNKKIADKRVEKEIEAERERLIEAQKLIYEQRLREARKHELREEYKIDELKANLEKDEQEEELTEAVKETKEDKKSKKKNKKQDSDIEELLKDEQPENIEEEKVEAKDEISVEELLDETSENESETN